MTAQTNRTLILDYLAIISGSAAAVTSENKSRSIGDFFAADAVWYVPQSNPLIVPNPRRGHAAVMDLLTAGVGTYRTGSLKIDLQRLITDETQAVAQFTLSAQLANGNDYRNHYCFIFSIAENKIDGVWEYLDTLYQAQQGAFDVVL